MFAVNHAALKLLIERFLRNQRSHALISASRRVSELVHAAIVQFHLRIEVPTNIHSLHSARNT
jgi:hypothetical protein